jgi:hypothetical protein
VLVSSAVLCIREGLKHPYNSQDPLEKKKKQTNQNSLSFCDSAAFYVWLPVDNEIFPPGED